MVSRIVTDRHYRRLLSYVGTGHVTRHTSGREDEGYHDKDYEVGYCYAALGTRAVTTYCLLALPRDMLAKKEMTLRRLF